MEVAKIKKNIEKILDDNKAQNITSINLKNKPIEISSTQLKKQAKLNI